MEEQNDISALNEEMVLMKEQIYSINMIMRQIELTTKKIEERGEEEQRVYQFTKMHC
jgi:hypothetical protein